MALKFRLKGLAETFIEELCCPTCFQKEEQENNFTTEHTRVTFEGIVVVAQCCSCGEVFLPHQQRLGVLDPIELKNAVKKDCLESGEPLFENLTAVKLNVEKLNAMRRGPAH